jgi:hypothetical protein
MNALLLQNGTLGFLAILALGCLSVLHFLLFREYYQQEKVQIRRLKELEYLVNLEISRSQSASKTLEELQEIKEKTNDQLEVIKLQIHTLDCLGKQPPNKNKEIR